jgi:hypothetical protein
MTEANTLDALIVKHIADLEAAKRRIDGDVDPRILQRASDLMKNWADTLGWVHKYFSETDGQIAVAPEEWIKRKENKDIETWKVGFSLMTVKTGDGFASFSHLAEFLGLEGVSSRKALIFFQNVLKTREWRMLLSKRVDEIKALRDLGFDVDEREGSIKLSVRLDSSALQRGFEEDDLDQALAPIREALELARKAMLHFEALAKAVLFSERIESSDIAPPHMLATGA